MANLTNSSKLIAKIESIDSKIWSIPEGTDIGEELSDIKDSIGTLPEGKTVVEEIAAAKKAGEGAAADVASDLSTFETNVANTYATKDSVASAFLYKGTKETYADLPASGNKTGDVWNIEKADSAHDVKAGDNVVWNGSAWDVLAGIVDLSNYYTKAEVDAAIDAGGEATAALAERVTTTEGKITALEGKASTAESDITSIKGRLDTAESDIDNLETAVSNVYTKTEVNTITGLSGASAGFASNTVSEAADGKVTATAADNVSIATAETNNKSAIAALATAHNNVVDRLEAVEGSTSSVDPTKWIDVTFNAGKTASVEDSFITAKTAVDTWVVTAGTAVSYAYEYEVEAGKITFKASDSESITMRVRLIKEYVAA